MNPFALASFVLLCLALVLHWAQRRNAWRHAAGTWPLVAKKPLAAPEQVLYQRLVSALPGHTVLSRVPLSSVLGVRRGHDAQAWARRLRHLHYDFVVCTTDGTVVAAIELDDVVRSRKDQQGADQFIERASDAAGMRLLRWQARALPAHAEIQAEFGVPLTHIFEDVVASANQSWWPALSSARRDAPRA